MSSIKPGNHHPSTTTTCRRVPCARWARWSAVLGIAAGMVTASRQTEAATGEASSGEAAASESQSSEVTPSATAPKASPAEARALPHGSVFLDPLGFLLFGPTLGVELGLGQFSAIAYGRWLDVGVLAKTMFLGDNDEFGFSFGAGLKGRYYFNPGLQGPHLGLAFELLKTRVDNDVDRIAIKNTIVVPELEGGYRIAFGQFYLGASAGVGYAFQASKTVENINGGDGAQNYEAKDVSTVYGSANLDLGLFF